MGLAAAAVATVMSGVFAVALLRRYLERGRVNRALAYWSAALAMFCAASLGLVVGEALGWSALNFRVYYLFGAVLTVPWLAVGTVAITAPDPVTRRILGGVAVLVALAFVAPMLAAEEPALFAVGVALGLLWGALLLASGEEGAVAGSIALVGTFTAVATFVVLSAQLTGPVPTDALPEGAELLPAGARAFAVAGNAHGAMLVIAGGVASALRLRRRGAPHLVVGNLTIALGVVIAASGGLIAFLGDTASHAIAFAVGVTVMYAGFVRTTRRPARAIPSRTVEEADT